MVHRPALARSRSHTLLPTGMANLKEGSLCQFEDGLSGMIQLLAGRDEWLKEEVEL
jgi:hypothetical protein